MGHKGCAAGWASDIWGTWRRGPNPISQEIVFFKSHNPSLCCSNWNPIPIFLLCFFMNPSPSAQNPISQPLKKGKSQLPFYPFTTLTFTQLDWRLRGSIWNWVMYQSNRSFNIPPGNPLGIWIFGKFISKFPLPPRPKYCSNAPSKVHSKWSNAPTPGKLFSSLYYALEAVYVNMV